MTDSRKTAAVQIKRGKYVQKPKISSPSAQKTDGDPGIVLPGDSLRIEQN